jgi:NAD(P)-dependent dehydrogenase (short-subunit alcohol dehydrogenase family)
MAERKTVLVTGASKGIGKATAEYFAAKGWHVYAAVREMRGVHFNDPAIQVVQMDVDSIGSIHRAFHLLKNKLDVVVNNAGFGLYGPFDSYTDSELEKQFSTNVLGVLRVTKAALPLLHKDATVVNISSVAGRVGLPYYSAYSASKFAVEGLSEALYYELAERHVRVKVVEPSTVKTDFFDPKKTAEHGLGKRLFALYSKAFRTGDEPETIAALIYSAATDGKDQLYYRPSKARRLLLAKKLLPANWFPKRYKRELYK